MGPCGPASAQRSLARRALPLGWAIGGAGGLVQAPPRRLQPDGPRHSFASGQAPASLNVNLTWPVPWLLASESPPELLAEHGRPFLHCGSLSP